MHDEYRGDPAPIKTVTRGIVAGLWTHGRNQLGKNLPSDYMTTVDAKNSEPIQQGVDCFYSIDIRRLFDGDRDEVTHEKVAKMNANTARHLSLAATHVGFEKHNLRANTLCGKVQEWRKKGSSRNLRWFFRQMMFSQTPVPESSQELCLSGLWKNVISLLPCQ